MLALPRKTLYDETEKKGSLNFHAKTIEKYLRIMYNICKMDYSAQKTPSESISGVEKKLISLGFRKKKELYAFGKGDVVLCFERNTFSSELLFATALRLVKNKIKAKVVVTDGIDCEINGNVVVFLRGGNKNGVVRTILPGETRYSFSRCAGVIDEDYAKRVFNLISRNKFYSVSLEKAEIVHSFCDDDETDSFSQEIARASIIEDENSGLFTMIKVTAHANLFSSDVFLSDVMAECGATEFYPDNPKPLGIVYEARKAVLVSVSKCDFADILLKFTEALNG